jgi:hypothetical protein
MKIHRALRPAVVLAALAVSASFLWSQAKPTKLEVITKTPSGATRNLRECQEIVVGFNQPMVPLEQLPEGDGTGPLVVTPPLRGKYRWKGTATLVFTPHDTLPYGTSYSVKVPAGTKSLSGQFLEKDVAWSFETPRVLLSSSQPYNGQENVDLKPLILLFFNQPMDTAKAAKFISVRYEDPDGRKTPVAAEVRALPPDLRNRYSGRERTILAVIPKKAAAPGQELGPDDFTDNLWPMFKEPRDSVSQYLASQFSAKAKGALKEYDTRYPPAYQLKSEIAAELNRIIKGPSIYREERFAKVKLTQGLKNLAGQKLIGPNLASLNRLLVIKAYDGYIDRQSKLPQNRWISVALAKGLPGAQGNLGLTQEATVRFRTYDNFRFLGAELSDNDPNGWLKFMFSNPVYYEELMANLEFLPTVKKPRAKSDDWYEEYYGEEWYYPSSSGMEPSFRFIFKPETRYQARISGKMRDVYGQTLGRDAEFAVNPGPYPPSVHIPTGLGVLEAYLPARIPVTVMNWQSVRRRLASVPVDSVVPLLMREWVFYSDMEQALPDGWFGINDDWNLGVKKNVRARLPLELKSALSSENTGLVYYDIGGLPEREDYRQGFRYVGRYAARGFIQVTNLGLTGKFSPEDVLLWVTRLRDGQPVSGAEVQLRDDSNRVVFKGKTDKDGVFRGPGWRELGIEPPEGDEDDYYYGTRPRLWAMASKGKDRAVLVSRWGMGIEPYEFGVPYDWNPKPVQYQGYLFTERGLYKAGEKVFIKGVFRQKRKGKWEVPAARSATMTIKDSRDEELVSRSIRLSDWGSFAYTLQLKADAPTGLYSVSVAGDSARRVRAYDYFRVEAYKPAEFEVTAGSAAPEYIAGDEFRGTIESKYLHGAPMAKAEYSWALRSSPYYFEPQGHEGFSFSGYWWWDGGYDYGNLLASKSGKLDEQGKVDASAKLDLGSARNTMAVTLEGTVTSPSRQSMSGRRQAVVHRGEFYVGLKQNTTFVDVDKPLKLWLLAVKPGGSKAPGQTVAVEVVRRQWTSVRQAGQGGRYEWRSEMKDSTVLFTQAATGSDPAEVSYTPKDPGFYLVKLSAKDARGNAIHNGSYFYAVGAGYVGWERRNDDRIDLIAEKSSLKPGETARIMVKSPYERTTALITLEREYVIQHLVRELSGSAPVIDIPITEEHLPNVFVSIVLLQGRLAEQKYSKEGDDLSKPSFKMGYLNLAVDPGSKRLSLEVATDRPSYGPRDSVTVNVTAADFKNQPALAEVTLCAVDKGVLNLIDFKTPNPFDAFYGARPLSVETAESRMHVIGQRNYGEKGENRGGGGGLEPEFRGDFQTTPFYRSALYTDQEGKLTARFRLPDNLTAFKIMATAHTRTSEFGAGEHSITVSKPIMLLPSLPRFVRVGDSLLAGVTVHNNTGDAQKVEVRAEAKGIRLLGPERQAVEVRPNQPLEVRFGYKANTMGPVVFRFSASSPGGQDGLEMTVPVRMPKLTEAVALYEQTDDRASQALVVPEKVWPDVGGLEISTASTALVGLESNLDYLITYPYGCCEQTMSKMMPMILAQDIVEAFGLAPAKGSKLRDSVRAGIEKIYRFQRSDGGFGVWYDSYWSSDYLTSYVLYGLYKAKQKGYSVDQQVVDRAVGYLSANLKWVMTPQKLNSPYSINGRLSVMAYSAYVLSLWGKKEPQAIDQLYEKRQQISIFGQAMLLRALKHTGAAAARQEEMAQIMLNNVKVTPTTWHFEEGSDEGGWWWYQSHARSTALVLSTLLEAQGQFANSEKIVKWLMSERKVRGRWRSTQENVFVFEALDSYFNAYEKDVPDFTATVRVENREILREIFKGRELKTRTQKFGLNEFKPGQKLPVEVAKEGPGRLYYGLRMIYAPLAPVRERDEGFAVSKRITTFKGDTLVKIFEAGKTYKVTLKVSTTQERHYVVVDDPLPAGFEVVNTAFATESQEQMRQMGRTQEFSGDDAWGRWWGRFDHTEIYDDRVLLFADRLANGNHDYSYFVKAVTAGTFALPQTKAEEMYTPEVFGWCPDRMVVIK